MKPKIKRLLALFVGLFAVLILFSSIWIWSLNSEIINKLHTRRFLPPTEFFTAPLAIYAGDQWSPEQVRNEFLRRNYSEVPAQQSLGAGRFWLLAGEDCLKLFVEAPGPSDLTCFIFSPGETLDPDFNDENKKLQALVWTEEKTRIFETYHGNPLTKSNGAFAEPQRFAQYIGKVPVLQTWTALGETPLNCLNAVLAIEDSHFLEHRGVSPAAIARATLKNLLRGRVAQGGSTITQQMVKNFFLNSERTFQRKLKEVVMSLLLEASSNKDEILETYLNIIYMGQSGPFEVRGFSAAARHYFGKELSQLETPECALLAAIINSPGQFDPQRKPKNALVRRARVLDRMQELGYLDPSEIPTAKASPLPNVTRAELWETAPYYLQAAISELEKKGINPAGMAIFTGLIPEHQSAAQKAVQAQIQKLESDNPQVKKISGGGISLEGLLLSLDLRSGWVTAAVGGRSFQQTQFNRILQGHRQIGSLIKPFVVYTALQEDRDLNALTRVMDARFTYSFEGQKWSPENYNKKYQGEVPLYFALKNSLNAATASLGLKAGLSKIIDVANLSGAKSEMKSLPSLTLGAIEFFPTEVLTMYSTLARMGAYQEPIWIRSVRDPSGPVLWQSTENPNFVLDSVLSAQVVSMMKQTLLSGTAQAVAKLGFLSPAAGKTGTTSDSRDAWFAGFTPRRLTVTWLGYDQKETHGLTGASATLPIWVDYMKQASEHDSTADFTWPAGTRVEKVKPELESKAIELIFREH